VWAATATHFLVLHWRHARTRLAPTLALATLATQEMA